MNDEQKLLKVNHEYDIDQIKALEQIEAVRVRPGMYIGSTSQSGIDQLVYEILDNSIDEYVAGCGTNISIKIFKDCSVEIADEGRGIPTGPHHIWKNKDGSPKDTLTGILTQLHAGGKFGGKDTGYKCFASNSLIYSDKGIKAIKDLSINDKVLDYHNEFQSIKQIFKYEYVDNINTLSLSNGKKIKAINGHYILIKRNNDLYWEKIENIHENDEVIELEENDNVDELKSIIPYYGIKKF